MLNKNRQSPERRQSAKDKLYAWLLRRHFENPMQGPSHGFNKTHTSVAISIRRFFGNSGLYGLAEIGYLFHTGDPRRLYTIYIYIYK